MGEKILLDLKNVTFTENKIIIKKKRNNIWIEYVNIKDSIYCKKSFINYLFMYGSNVPPGWLLINFKDKISWRKGIAFKIKYDDLIKLPKNILSILSID